jgi:hypothetical protein
VEVETPHYQAKRTPAWRAVLAVGQANIWQLFLGDIAVVDSAY